MASWKEKRRTLIRLIKAVSNAYGGDNEDELNLYIKEVIEKYKSNLDEAIACFVDLTKGI